PIFRDWWSGSGGVTSVSLSDVRRLVRDCVVGRWSSVLGSDASPITNHQGPMTDYPPLVLHAPSRPSEPRGSAVRFALALLVLRDITSPSASHVYSPLRSASLNSPTSTCAVARASPMALCRTSIETP